MDHVVDQMETLLAGDTAEPLLSLRGLRVTFHARGRTVEAVRGIDLDVQAGRTLGVVGESGSGKSVSLMAVLGLLPPGAEINGSIHFGGTELLTASDAHMRRIRSAEIGIVFQDPISSLNPVMTIGAQIDEVLRTHGRALSNENERRNVALLREVGIAEPERRVKEYPHQFSGGMRQRAMIAMALACEPKLLIADEATTALDVTVQAQILDLVDQLRSERDMTVVWVSHDLGVVAQMADDIVVMKDGVVVESGPCAEVFHEPQAAYTQKLLGAMPRIDRPLAELPTPPPLSQAVLEVKDLEVAYGSRALPWARDRRIRAVDGVTIRLEQGKTVGLVGESGSGKSSLARAIIGLERPTAGQVLFEGEDILTRDRRHLDKLRREAQMVFQDPAASMNPGMTIEQIVTEPLLIHGQAGRRQRKAIARELLDMVELPTDFAGRYPHELSGGQRQRAAIARALGTQPRLLICDEPVSALDVSVQAQILALLRRLQDELSLALLVISHDLAVIRDIAHEVYVMYLGVVVERAEREELFGAPAHPYTQGLLSAVPVPEPSHPRAPFVPYGDPPDPSSPPPGCRFSSRCPLADEGACAHDRPALLPHGKGHLIACHHADTAARRASALTLDRRS